MYYINLIGFVPASALFLYPYSDIALHSSTNLQHVEHIGIGEVMVVLSIFDVFIYFNDNYAGLQHHQNKRKVWKTSYSFKLKIYTELEHIMEFNQFIITKAKS